jgi:DNA-binding MarR family transcriptional regulator
VTSSAGNVADHISELADRLERTFRLLGKRIYLPSLRRLSSISHGLDRASIPLLGVLEEQGEVRPSDLAAALELDPSTVSRQLGQLERLGLVQRSADQADGRATLIGLTPAGRGNLATVRQARAALLEDVLAQWNEADREQLQALLDRLLESLAALPTPRVVD